LNIDVDGYSEMFPVLGRRQSRGNILWFV